VPECSPGGGIGPSVRLDLKLIVAGRQEEREDRAASGLAAHLERAVVAAHNAEHGGEAEPAPGEFGREKWLENAAERFRGHAATGVADFEKDVLAFRQSGIGRPGRKLVGVDISAAGSQRDDAGLGADRVGGIDHEVHHDLADLRGVGHYGGQRAGQLELEVGLFADGEAQQRKRAFDQLVEIERLDEEAAFAGVGEELLAELGGPERGRLDLADVGRGWRVGRQLEPDEARIAHDAGEQIVEIVRDAAGEHAEAFEFLGFEKFALHRESFRLGLFALRDLALTAPGRGPADRFRRSQSRLSRKNLIWPSGPGAWTSASTRR
jgi:hypothetical protein